ncbi:MAG: adenosylcobalamin-dependent ribonucleoside-diphosphate reductase [Candidatus Woesearchaeota archaeon]
MNLPIEYKKYVENLKINQLGKEILEKRYLARDKEGNIIETIEELFFRVANNIAQADNNYKGNIKETEEEFFKVLTSLELVPASPILMNAGNRLQFLFSDHALEVSDSLENIFEVLKIAATIQQNGGGVGFNFSKIRPRFDEVSGLKNVAFGPLSVMEIFDKSFSAILQGGRRPGANMAILSISHPDIEDFIEAKKNLGVLSNFNLSISVTDEFIDAVINDKDFNLINPRNNEVAKTLKARDLFLKITSFAWGTGDPGLIFIDEMNRKYPFEDKKVLCTSCCGQYELEAYEGVPYAHINLTKILNEKNEVDLEKLKNLIHTAVHFLDNCIDMHKYTHPLIEQKTKETRKIGLGVMGFADLLFMLNIEYGSEKCLELITTIMRTIKKESRKASKALSFKRGTFPLFGRSSIDEPTRNATLTSIAPTGSTSLIAGVSQSIEPVYALSYTSKNSSGAEYTVLNSIFKKAVDELNITTNEKVQLQFVDSVAKISWIDDNFKKVFKTSLDISPNDHLKVMATFQKFVDNSISKTINLPHLASIQDVQKIYLDAFKFKCKGITIYRDGCRSDQILSNKHQTKLYAFEN